MKYQYLTQALCSSVLLLNGVSAEEAAAEASPVAVEKPTFSPSEVSGDFVEQFASGLGDRWIPSKAKKDDPKSEEDWAYVGEWAVEEPSVFPGIEGDKGLVVKNPAAHHAISAKFPKKIDNKGKTLVVQYEVKLQKGLECGGAYMKLLQDNKKLHAEEFSNSSPYIIMFGPDKCGSTNKVHFIIRHKNPKSGEYEEKHLNAPAIAPIDDLTHLYTLIIKPDQTFEVKIDGESKKSGSLLEDFAPAFNPEKEIDDPKDSKPDTWVDEAKIQDPEAAKPEDWDEDAPFEIIDEAAEKPEDWLENEPQTIPDPEAEKPEDWDDEEDGDWIPPQVPNPKCAEVSGCGPWEKPTIKNPAYRGKWSAPYVDNPAYKGVWAPRKIKNPNYFEDKTPANLEPMGAIGFEIWTMQGDILFDNIYIGHSESEAEKFKAETFDIKNTSEKAQKDAAQPKVDAPKLDAGATFLEDPIGFSKNKIDIFTTIFKNDPMAAIKAVPEVTGVAIVLFGVLASVLFAIVGVNSAVAADNAKRVKAKGKEAVIVAKDKVAEAVTTGSEKVQSEVNKRTTRSSATNEN